MLPLRQPSLLLLASAGLASGLACIRLLILGPFLKKLTDRTHFTQLRESTDLS
jgi:hypothetical protein